MRYQNYVLPTLFVVLIALSIFIIRPFITALLLGALIAFLTYPLYKFLYRKTLCRNISAMLITILVFLIIIVPTLLLVKSLAQQSYAAVEVFQEQISSTATMFAQCSNSFCVSINSWLQDPQMGNIIQDSLQTVNTKFFEKGSQIIFSIPRIILELFVMLFGLFFFLRDGRTFIDAIQEYLKMQSKEYHHLLFRLKDIVHGVVYGYLLIALIQGTFGGIGFFIFGVDSPIFWGLIMAILALIPMVGTGIIWAPAGLFLFFQGIFLDSPSVIFKGVGLLLYGLLIISTIDNILRPKLVGDRAKIHPLIIMAGILGGVAVFGTLGVFIGPVVLSFTTVLIQTYMGKKAGS